MCVTSFFLKRWPTPSVELIRHLPAPLLGGPQGNRSRLHGHSMTLGPLHLLHEEGAGKQSLGGNAPTFRQTPPSFSVSTQATLMPSWAPLMAAT